MMYNDFHLNGLLISPRTCCYQLSLLLIGVTHFISMTTAGSVSCCHCSQCGNVFGIMTKLTALVRGGRAFSGEHLFFALLHGFRGRQIEGKDDV